MRVIKRKNKRILEAKKTRIIKTDIKRDILHYMSFIPTYKAKEWFYDGISVLFEEILKDLIQGNRAVDIPNFGRILHNRRYSKAKKKYISTFRIQLNTKNRQMVMDYNTEYTKKKLKK